MRHALLHKILSGLTSLSLLLSAFLVPVSALPRPVEVSTWGTPAWQKPQTSHATYDSTYHAYRLVEENELEQQTTWTYNTACGLAESETGPNGAATTILAGYDEACRLVMLVRPGDSLQYPTLQISYFDNQQPFRIDLQQRVTAGQVSLQRRYVDGLGRMVQQVMVGAALADNACSTDADTLDDSCDVRVDYRYDGNGQLIQQTVPYAAPTNSSGAWSGQQLGQPSMHTGYDLLGRVSLVTAPDGTQTASSYSDGGESLEQGAPYTQRCVTDANAQTTCTLTDLLGQVRRVIPPLGPQVAYSYDVEDQLVGSTYGGASTLLSYDLAGRKLGMDDPDLGSWSYAYYALGNLTRQADARGQRVCLYYDALNRLSGKHYRLDDACPGSAPGSPDVAYVYDGYDPQSGQYGIGYRTGMVDDSGSTSWEYDARGRAVEETKIISPTLSFTTLWAYNSADLVASMTYPDGEALTYTYHPQLALNSLMSNRDTNNQANNYYILQHTAYDAAGRSVRQWLGAANLAQNSTLVKVNTYNAWNTQGGRLQRTNAGLYNTPVSVLDQSYTYDTVGNIVSLVDAQNSGQKQCFTYDALDRLTSARVGDASCNGLLGNGEYADEGYTYDAITGNLSSKTGMGSYSYGDTAHKHAVTATGSGWAYQYDFNGNMTRRDPPGSDYYDFNYDAENRLHVVEKNEVGLAEFTYDGKGARVQAEVNGTVTYFSGGIYESTGGVITKYYTASGVRLAMRSGAGLIFLFGDHLGSTSATYRVSDATITRQLYKPWGEPRYASASLPTPYTYTGQYHYTDDITTPGVTEGFGLMFYNARWYDPCIMQFNQPDTLIPDPYNPLDWNRYSYARDNPIRYKDPTGHWIESVIDIASIAYDIYEISHNGLNWGTGLALAADIGGLILPGVTGGGIAVRALTYADEVVDAARAIDAAGDTVQAINQGVNAVQAANKVSNGLSAFSRASEFGIKSYNDLRSAISGTGLEAHHLIEQRFAQKLGLDPGSIPSIALTRQEHQAFTNAWRSIIGYSTDNKKLTTLNATADDVWAAVQKIFAKHPELLAAVKKALGK